MVVLGRRRSWPKRAAAVATVVALSIPLTASIGPPHPADAVGPDLITLLQPYTALYRADPADTLHGEVEDAPTFQRDDELTVWINQHATSAEKFLALQDSAYDNPAGTSYDQSITLSTGLGSVLGPIYVEGRRSGTLPLTSALINSETGSAGAYVGTGVAKAAFSHPRPYLPTDPAATLPAGDDAACSPSAKTVEHPEGVNGSSQRDIRVGRPWSDAKGNLAISRVAPVTDTTHRFSPTDVGLDPGYGTTGICSGGSFPSGHTTTAYEAGVTLATLLPQLAPEILARASEAGNNRIVLGVHYPLDVMGGRIDGEAALAARWSDAKFRRDILLPARHELVTYLEQRAHHSLAYTTAHQRPYQSNPYGGAHIPGGTAQIVLDRRSAVAVYRERLTYSFGRDETEAAPSEVPAGASNLLLTTFPSLTDAQRTSVLAQTETASGYPLDGTGTPAGAWVRLDLAAAQSASVVVSGNGAVSVVRTGGQPEVIRRCNCASPRPRPGN